MPPQKMGTYGTSCFKSGERFPKDKPSPTAQADFFTETTPRRIRGGGYIDSKADRFRDPLSKHRNLTANADYYVPKGVGSNVKNTSSWHKTNQSDRFKMRKSVTENCDDYKLKSFTEEITAKKFGKSIFGTGERFKDNRNKSATVNCEDYNPKGFAEKVVENAKKKNSASSWSKATSRFQFKRPVTADADYYIPRGCGERGQHVMKLDSGGERFKDRTKQNLTKDADFYVEPEDSSLKKPATPALASFRSKSPRFREGSPGSGKNQYADAFYDMPSFVDEILKK